MYKRFIKPFFDFLVAFSLSLLLSPLFVLLSILLAFHLKGSPYFLQKRPGKGERIFRVVKFRTMNNKEDEKGHLLPDEKRLTGFGKWVRASSLDELPQLFNVVLGDMSLVGPRPLLPEYLPLYNEHQRQRHLVKPGITGWAQVNGRNRISWEEKFDLDVYYVQNLTFALDIKILLKSMIKVFIREGITQEDSVSARKFKGSLNKE
ncbi:MAG: sugar transferase [Flavobacteriaceae bacterium]|nr:sugar transferase [Flavobacteriaceae bacterium]